MNRTNLFRAVIVVLAVIGFYFFNDGNIIEGNQSSTQTQAVSVVSDQGSSFIVANQVIYDLDGRVAYRGEVDLNPTLARIERGEKDPHDNDGAIFGNREGLLPARERGYYREYVVRTPSISHAGPQRIVMGEGGEIYYTPDHYESFVRLDQ